MPILLDSDPKVKDARTMTNWLLGGISFGTVARQDAQRIAEGQDARRVMREREAIKSRIADVLEAAIVPAPTLDRAFFEGLAGRVLRVVRP